jgi:hypothetical protein
MTLWQASNVLPLTASSLTAIVVAKSLRLELEANLEASRGLAHESLGLSYRSALDTSG